MHFAEEDMETGAGDWLLTFAFAVWKQDWAVGPHDLSIVVNCSCDSASPQCDNLPNCACI